MSANDSGRMQQGGEGMHVYCATREVMALCVSEARCGCSTGGETKSSLSLRYCGLLKFASSVQHHALTTVSE